MPANRPDRAARRRPRRLRSALRAPRTRRQLFESGTSSYESWRASGDGVAGAPDRKSAPGPRYPDVAALIAGGTGAYLVGRARIAQQELRLRPGAAGRHDARGPEPHVHRAGVYAGVDGRDGVGGILVGPVDRPGYLQDGVGIGSGDRAVDRAVGAALSGPGARH